MNHVLSFPHLLRISGALLIALLALTLDMSSALAQSASCSRLNAQLRTLDRNGDFRDWEQNSAELNQLAAQLQDAESAYIRGGCNDAARAGQTLSRDCQVLARQIVRGRADREELSSRAESGNAIAQQREALLQEISRFGCGAGGESSVTVNSEPSGRDGLFNQLFGGYTRDDNYYGDGEIVDNQGFGGLSGYSTVRTLCVRLSDGYFWPISYSTLPDFVGNDLAQCQAQCPDSDVDLYYYNNPGEEVEQMRNLSGSLYTSLPAAFKYRSAFDPSQTCKAQTTLTVAEGGGFESVAGGGNEDPVFGMRTYDIAELGFPMPSRDPRGPMVAVAAVQPSADAGVPLPRRRPGSAQPADAVSTADARIVEFGGKRVRIVGPETPYAQAGAKGT